MPSTVFLRHFYLRFKALFTPPEGLRYLFAVNQRSVGSKWENILDFPTANSDSLRATSSTSPTDRNAHVLRVLRGKGAHGNAAMTAQIFHKLQGSSSA